jgi:GT2 family glycosyltransferase
MIAHGRRQCSASPATAESMTSNAPRVAGLVLNYNGRDVTLLSLQSLLRLNYPAVDLVVIDNGSTDDSRAAIARAHPDLLQLRVAENRGISWGLNHGLRWALDAGYDYVLAMNNDIEVSPNLLRHLVDCAESDPAIGCVGPKSYYYYDRERLWSTGGLLRFRESVTRERGDREIDRGQYDRDEAVPYVNGCAMLARREALEATGLWDPVYYVGVEDADWCVRMKRNGFRCHYAHRAKLWHMISHSLGVYRPSRTFHTGRSSAIFLRKYASPAQWVSALCWFAAAVVAAYARELPRRNQGAAVAKLRGFLTGLRVELAPIPEPPLIEPAS